MENNTEDETIYQLLECIPRMLLYGSIFGIIGCGSAVVGILGNITSVIVLVQPSMRSSTSILLVAMAAYDTLLLTTCLLRFVHILNTVNDDPMIIGSFESTYFNYVEQIAFTGTIYTTVMVTIERAVVVVFPLKAKLVCTKTKASVACVAVFLLSLIYSVPNAIVYYQFNYYNINYSSIRLDFKNSYFYRYVYMIYLNTVFHVVLPVGVIIILNTAIIQRLCMRGRQMVDQISSRGDNQTKLTVMIIILTGIFSASMVMFMIIIYLDDQPESASVCPLRIFVIYCVVVYIVILNSATNFIVYSIFGHKFRRCLHELCCSRHSLQAHRPHPETQVSTRNKISMSASSLLLNIL